MIWIPVVVASIFGLLSLVLYLDMRRFESEVTELRDELRRERDFRRQVTEMVSDDRPES